MTEKRVRPRLRVSMPVQVIGRANNGEIFRELSQTQDASAFGLCFTLQSTVIRGTILYLSMPMPRRLRLYDLAKEVYQIYAQVQRVQMLPNGGCEVGISFLGKNPPAGFENYQTSEFINTTLKKPISGAAKGESPATLPTSAQASLPTQPSVPVGSSVPTRPPTRAAAIPPPPPPRPPQPPPPEPKSDSDGKKQRRRDSRYQIPIDVMIEFLDAHGNTLHQEPGLIINISKGGACVMSTYNTQIGSRLKVTMMRENFSAQAAVKAINTGQGGVWNIHLEFLDKCWMGGGD
ncbi:MAG: PilZ domain-containing protein [Acidobacteriota bacterium]